MAFAYPRKTFRHWPRICEALLVACLVPLAAVRAEPSKPILVSAPTSTRAVALDAVAFTSEPFSPAPKSFLYGPEEPTSIILFVLNLSLNPGEDASALTADAEDAAHKHYNLKVEYVGKVPGQEWLSQLNLRLDAGMGDVGDVLIKVTHQGVASNRVRVGIGHVGGGPTDDEGAAPTPAPPYTISGRVLSGGAGLGGVKVTLGGAQTATATTAADGSYAFLINAVGNYTVNASKKFYTLTPPASAFENLSGDRTLVFDASLDKHTISGTLKDDEGRAMKGLPVTLRSVAGDFTPRTIAAGDGGEFSFGDVPAGRGYTIEPLNTSLYAFTPQSVGELDGDVALAFNGTRRRYTIGGVIKDYSGRAVEGVGVTLTGELGASATTDANGRYSFANLVSGKLYNLHAAKIDYLVSPETMSFILLRDETADFFAARQYRITGRVTDSGGKGIYDIVMKLVGPETVTVLTDLDGSYGFIVTTEGSYQLFPFKEQDLYRYAPPSRSFNLTTTSPNLTLNFTAGILLTSPTHVLEFDGTPMSADYGVFWAHDTTVGNFFWEFWAMPGENTQGRYLLSDGYGGSHTLLFGFNHGPRGYSFTGNVWNGTGVVSFGSDEGPSVGEWGHYAVGWDGKSINTYYDGVPVGKVAFNGPRVSLGTGSGSTLLLIGGSNHQNLIGRIAQVRGYEENNPHAAAPESSFAPQTVFSVDGQLLSYYFRPAERVADLSPVGFNGSHHNGWPRGMLEFYFNFSCPGCPVPQFVIDPTAPDFANPNNPVKAKTLVVGPPPTPSGARVFDSFSRDNATYILGGKGGLGTTEAAGASAGAKVWQTNVEATVAQPFGILGGRAVLLADAESLAWVSTGALSANLNISVERTAGSYGSGVNTGLCFRVADKNNFFFAYTTDDPANPSAPKRLTLGFYQSGTRTVLASNIPMPSGNWKTLRVITTQAGSIKVYAEDALVHSAESTTHAFSTGAGLYNHAAGMGLSNRWDNFTVLDVPQP